MPEPTSTTAATTTGLAAVSLLPFINGNALLGAVLGQLLWLISKRT